MDSKLYTISDIHGNLIEFENMLLKINLKKEDKLVLLGDYVDRGTNSIDVILKIIQMKKDGYNIECLKGNHEQIFLDCISKFEEKDDMERDSSIAWLLNVGAYGTMVDFFNRVESERVEIVSFLQSLKLYHKEKNYFFVHAGVNPNVKLSEQKEDDYLWIRNEFIQANTTKLGYTFVFGHTPTRLLREDKEDLIWFEDNKIGIDCGCVFGGKLACIELNDMKEYYICKQKKDV